MIGNQCFCHGVELKVRRGLELIRENTVERGERQREQQVTIFRGMVSLLKYIPGQIKSFCLSLSSFDIVEGSVSQVLNKDIRLSKELKWELAFILNSDLWEKHKKLVV